MGILAQQLTAPELYKLQRDGSNLGQYLWEIRERDLAAFEGILEALRFVLPFASDVQPRITQEIESLVHLQMAEEDFKVPGWLLSTGTLRILAILAALRHPNPPPLLVIEEVENGLDPRTMHLLVEEIRAVITAQTTQVILTTHSPYLLDLLDLSHIIVTERVNGEPTFVRPDEDELQEWAKSFSPGRLYTMGRLTRGNA
jgi:predicted ATPase